LHPSRAIPPNTKPRNNMKTRTVKFSYGTVKDASLKIPAEDFSLVQVADLTRQSYLEYAFRPGCGLMSDECLTSSIGHSNFMAGALGGYKTRLESKAFAGLKSMLIENDVAMALAVAKFRNPSLTQNEAYIQASKNEVLSETERKLLTLMAEKVAA
jgi:hypothetical protein